MGLFGKMFEKKNCDICGGEIGLLGNRKLADGNLCKDCAKKLSPFLEGRRQCSVEEIARHLDYRAENERRLAALSPTRVFGNGTKVYLDEPKKVFFVCSRSDWRGCNPDIMELKSVRGCDIDIREHKTEIYQKDEEGRRASFDPPRYEVAYSFHAHIAVDSPWFSDIDFELTDERPDSPYTDLYRRCERDADELRRALTEAPAPTAPAAAPGAWTCLCGAEAAGRFCSACGAPRPQFCSECGAKIEDAAAKFCSACGHPLK